MMPYYSFPFVYSYRQNANIMPAPAPMPVPQMLPEAEEAPDNMPGIMPLPMDVSPNQQMMPMLPCQQIMPAQQGLPMSPCPNMMPNIMPNMMPNIMPNIMPNMMPANTMPETTPNVMPNTMPNMIMPDVMPNTMPEMMPNIMPNMMPNMMPGMEEMDDDDVAYFPSYNYAYDRRPILSNNPPVTRITLFKELTGYSNYGNPSGNADILYTGDRGEWTFNLPAGFGLGATQRAQLVIRVVLDDHYDVNANRYSANITINGNRVHTGRIPAEHGRPAGQMFTNWRELTFNIGNLRRNNRIVIENTSNAGQSDWIAFDWMEMRVTPR